MFKNIFIIVAICFLSINDVFAQEIDHARDSVGSVTSYEAVFKDVFTSYSDLDSMHLQFDGNQPAILILFFRKKSLNKNDRQHNIRDYFDLEFEGDKYLLQKSYKPVFAFVTDTSRMNVLGQLKNNKNFAITLYRDSLAFRRGIYGSGTIRATLRSNRVEGLTKELEHQYEDKYSPLGDSVIIIQAVIERDSELGDMGVIVGEYSPFYDFVKRILLVNREMWAPLRDGSGSPRRGLIDIFIRLNANRSIDVSATGRGRKLLIEDTTRSSPILH